MLKTANIYTSTLYYYLQKKKGEKFRSSYNYDINHKKKFEQFIESLNSENLFVHAALSSVKTFDNENNPYSYFRSLLLSNFESVTTNGFTPNVKKTWNFDLKKDKPIYGAFAKLMFEENSFRNADPLFSICGIGSVKLPINAMSFSQNGLFHEMLNRNYTCLNVGLKYVTCSLNHHIEYELNVPYINKKKSNVSIIIEGEKKIFSYDYYEYVNKYSIKGYIRWNKRKLMKDLRDEKILSEDKFGAVQIYHFELNRFYDMVKRKIQQDPFYLVTW